MSMLKLHSRKINQTAGATPPGFGAQRPHLFNKLGGDIGRRVRGQAQACRKEERLVHSGLWQVHVGLLHVCRGACAGFVKMEWGGMWHVACGMQC